MAKNITLMGADYPQVPAVQLPQTGGGTATFYDIQVVDNLNSDSSTDALSAKQGKVLNEKTTKNTFIAPGYKVTSNYTFELPETPSEGHAYFVVLTNYTSATTIVVDVLMINFSSPTTLRNAWITHNSTANIQSITVSGKNVTINFTATVYASLYFIRCM